MATAVKMPKMGMSMSEGLLAKWLKADGDRIDKGEPIVEIESDKITNVVEAQTSGRLHRVGSEDETYAVGEILGYILAEGEEAPADAGEIAQEAPASGDGQPAPAAAPTEPSAKTATKKEFVLASPIARRLARENDIDLADVEGTGPGGRVTEDDVRAYIDTRREVKISPVARKMAEEAGLDLSALSGTGPGGKITKEDVQQAVEAEAAPAPAEQGARLSGMRRTIAERMTESLQNTAQVTVFTEVDVTELVAVRERLKQNFALSYTDLIVQAAARALQLHPKVNASLVDGRLVQHDDVHVGVAVALDDGLIVPVIRDADRKSLRDIAAEIRELAERARAGTLTPDDVSGATFSVTNLGMYGIDGFTPILNMPEAAILGVGRIIEKPAAYRGSITLRHILVLSLTFDHRVVDGAPASAFLQTVADMLSMPYLISAE